MKNNENGRSMIEMLGVLAIIGVLSVGGIAGFSKAMAKYRINKSISQITMIAQNIRTLFASQNNYNDLSSEESIGKSIIQKAKIVPEEMMELGNNGKLSRIVDPFGGVVAIFTENKETGNDHKAFSIIYQLFSEDACIDLLSYEWSNIGVNVVGVVDDGSYIKYLVTPITVGTAAETCTAVAATVAQNNSAFGLYFLFDVDIHSAYWQNIINGSN